MTAGNGIPGLRGIVGDILLVLIMRLTADVAYIMPARIKAVVRKADYRKAFLYEIILCAILLLFAFSSSSVLY